MSAAPAERVLVTGADGFIGRHFLAAAAQAGLELVGLVREAVPADAPAGVHWLRAPLDAFPAEVMAGCGTLVHFAAAGVSARGGDWDLCFDVNVRQSLALWRDAARAGVRAFVICGSCFEYGRSAERYERVPVAAPLEPVTAYAASKAAATMAALALAAQEGVTLSVLRPFHVYGDGEAPGRFWPSLRAAALAGQDFPMTEGRQVRDFVPVDVVAQRFLREVLRPGALPGLPRVHNVGTGQPCTLEAFARSCWSSLGATGRLLPGAVPMRPGEIMRFVPELE